MSLPRKPRRTKSGDPATDGKVNQYDPIPIRPLTPRLSQRGRYGGIDPEPIGPTATVWVATIEYTVNLCRGLIMFNGDECRGLCDGTLCRIYISDALSPSNRMATFWHELAHAVQYECDISEGKFHNDEALCNMFSLGLSTLNPKTLEDVRVLLTSETTEDELQPSRLFFQGAESLK